MSGGRSVRGGIRAFLFGAELRGRDLSGVHRSKEGGENTDEEEEEEEGKEGSEIGGGAGGGSSTETVRGPVREKNKMGHEDKLERTEEVGGRGEDWKTDMRRGRRRKAC